MTKQNKHVKRQREQPVMATKPSAQQGGSQSPSQQQQGGSQPSQQQQQGSNKPIIRDWASI